MSTPPVRAVLPHLRGGSILFATPNEHDYLAYPLIRAGYTVIHVGTAEVGDRRGVQARLAEELHLPGSAGTNLDALVDSLRDLPLWWPQTPALALIWSGGRSLLDADLPSWYQLLEILGAAVRSAERPRLAIVAVVDRASR